MAADIFVGRYASSVPPFRIQRPHHTDPREHSRPAVLGDQDQRLDRGLPCWRVVLGFRQLCDVVGGVAQGDELAAIG